MPQFELWKYPTSLPQLLQTSSAGKSVTAGLTKFKSLYEAWKTRSSSERLKEQQVSENLPVTARTLARGNMSLSLYNYKLQHVLIPPI